jgi:tetratricopeptide (TPR) repeat protein
MALWLLAGPAVLPAQEPLSPHEIVARARSEAGLLERQGRFVEAAAAYVRGLDVEPANTTLLMGLERMLARVGRLGEALPYLARAAAADPTNEIIHGLHFSVAARIGGADSAAAVAARWMATVRGSVMPYREWSRWLAQRGDTDAALAVLARGRARFGDVQLAEHTAPVLTQAGAWVEAAEQWAVAVAVNRGILSPAGASLGRAPTSLRDAMLEVLIDAGNSPGTWLASDLLLQWGRPQEGWVLLDRSLPGPRPEGARLVRRFADRAASVGTRDATLARGYALERLAQLTGGVVAEQARLQAAQAFADAGNLVGAERLLSQLSLETPAQSAAAAEALTTFIRVLAESGQVEEADRQFRRWEDQIAPGDVEEIREHLAWGWVQAGDFERAEEMINGDSTVGALSVQGWIALYRGDLATAKARLAAAGPYARPREETTRSASILVLLERVRTDRLEELGAALVSLAAGDTAAAVVGLRRAADRLPDTGGRADVLAFGGELAAASGDQDAAERLLGDALAADSAGPSAPAAALLLATVYTDAERNDEAVVQLEHLILTYPESAVVPQARRLLDRVRGMIPKT